MFLKRTIFLIYLTTASLGVAAAQETASPVARPSTEPTLAKPKHIKARAKPPCPRGQWRESAVCFDASALGASPTPAKIAEGGGPQLFLKRRPSRAKQDSIPYQNDLPTPNHPPHGGAAGLRFPF